MKHDGYVHPPHLGWQVDWPVFVKRPFSAFGKPWKIEEEFNWQLQVGAQEDKIAQLYKSGYIQHNRDLEVTTKVGDRLSELNSEQLLSLVKLVNKEVQSRTSTTKEYNNKKIKQSRIDDKQRGLIRGWLNRNNWMLEDYYRIRDSILGE